MTRSRCGGGSLPCCAHRRSTPASPGPGSAPTSTGPHPPSAAWRCWVTSCWQRCSRSLHGWMFFLVAWALPLFFFFQISNVLRLCVEHTFPEQDVEVRRGRAYMAGLSNAIFLGEPVPGDDLTGGRRGYAWVRWTLRMALIRLPQPLPGAHRRHRGPRLPPPLPDEPRMGRLPVRPPTRPRGRPPRLDPLPRGLGPHRRINLVLDSLAARTPTNSTSSASPRSATAS